MIGIDVFDFEIITGDDFYYTYVFFEDDDITPKDLTGYSFKCQIKDPYDNNLIYDITDITINGNKVTLHIPNTDTATFRDLFEENESKLLYNYDLQITIPNTEPQFPNGAVQSIPRHKAIIKQDVTL